MAVIHDIYEKMKHWNPEPPITIISEDHADKLNCSKCGKQYPSRGKWDCGICRDCERKEVEKNATLIGGPCDGEKAGETHDER